MIWIAPTSPAALLGRTLCAALPLSVMAAPESSPKAKAKPKKASKPAHVPIPFDEVVERLLAAPANPKTKPKK